MSRRIRMEWKAPGSATVNGREVVTFGDKEKVRLLVMSGGDAHSPRRAVEACEKAGLFPGAVVMWLPAGAEFQLWEEP